ncbi:Phosphotransferase enzyme family protein [Sphingobium faniae]|nr:Phosphotransferase enzyme family protein [Sphingobium faniae]
MSGQDENRAFEWVESLMDGKIVEKKPQIRWRQHWYLKVRQADGGIVDVLLRGHRIPGGHVSPDEAHAKAMLKTDAETLEYLQGLPIRTPRYYGFNEDLGWMLMENVPGEAEITGVSDPELRARIYREYLHDIAVIHSQPLDVARVPTNVHVPRNSADMVDRYMADTKRRFDEEKRNVPEPIFRLGYQWLLDNPIGDRPLKLCLCDVGPNQFIFKDGAYVAPFDFECALVCDPLLDIAMMRMREMTYSIGGTTDHVLYYGSVYEELTGQKLDIDALHYWTMFGEVCFGLWFNKGAQFPLPKELDSVFILAWEVQQRRSIVEALADKYRIELDELDIPAPVSNVMTTAFDLMKGQFREFYSHKFEEWNSALYTDYASALADSLGRSNEFGNAFHGANVEELSDLISRKVDDWRSGLAILEDLIAQDYEKDFEERLKFLHRSALRQEYLYEPMQRATGVSPRTPLSRLYS